ncbi:DUF397 domain-containing protein [Micromonosporaceae bacterium Da 78-11]
MEALINASWFKSSRSGAAGHCVEAAFVPTGVGIRDSKDKDGATLLVDNSAWGEFIDGVKAGEFDLNA